MSPLYKRVLVHTGFYLVLFFLIPYIQNNSHVMNDLGTLLLLLLMVNPAAVMILNAEAGLHQGFNIALCLLPALLFALSVFLVFDGNSSAQFYTVAYGVIAIVSNGIGSKYRKKNMRTAK